MKRTAKNAAEEYHRKGYYQSGDDKIPGFWREVRKISKNRRTKANIIKWCRMAGRVRSRRKALAARRNGRKGGRPRKINVSVRVMSRKEIAGLKKSNAVSGRVRK